MERKMRRKVYGGAAALCLLAVPFFWWQNNGLTLTRYTVALPQLPAELEGITLVHISDLHNKRLGEEQQVLLDTIQQAQPDAILITGDLVDRRRTDLEPALELAVGAAALAPTYYVTGNHERGLPQAVREQLLAGLEAAGVILLDDRVEELTFPGGGRIALGGLSDDSLRSGTLWARSIPWPEDVFSVLLAHEPQYVEDYARMGADLVFCGHAHGGQIRLPLVGGLIAPGQGFLPAYTSGVYGLGETRMVVSRGIGNSKFPLRFHNRPQVVAVTLERT